MDQIDEIEAKMTDMFYENEIEYYPCVKIEYHSKGIRISKSMDPIAERQEAKIFYQNKINYFNERFKFFKMHPELSLIESPFGGKGQLFPVPDSLRSINETAAEFVDSYNEFAAINSGKLRKYSFMIMNNVSKPKNIKEFDVIKVDDNDSPYKMEFILRTNEKNLIETMPIIICYEQLQWPKFYSLNGNKCTLYFDEYIGMNYYNWKSFLNWCQEGC